MKPFSIFCWSVSLLGACLLSACASNPNKGDDCCSSGGGTPAAKTSSSSAAKTVAKGSGKAVGGVPAAGSVSGKVREHVTDSTQHEIVRETKPVIGDDSELRK